MRGRLASFALLIWFWACPQPVFPETAASVVTEKELWAKTTAGLLTELMLEYQEAEIKETAIALRQLAKQKSTLQEERHSIEGVLGDLAEFDREATGRRIRAKLESLIADLKWTYMRSSAVVDSSHLRQQEHAREIADGYSEIRELESLLSAKLAEKRALVEPAERPGYRGNAKAQELKREIEALGELHASLIRRNAEFFEDAILLDLLHGAPGDPQSVNEYFRRKRTEMLAGSRTKKYGRWQEKAMWLGLFVLPVAVWGGHRIQPDLNGMLEAGLAELATMYVGMAAFKVLKKNAEKTDLIQAGPGSVFWKELIDRINKAHGEELLSQAKVALLARVFQGFCRRQDSAKRFRVDPDLAPRPAKARVADPSETLDPHLDEVETPQPKTMRR